MATENNILQGASGDNYGDLLVAWLREEINREPPPTSNRELTQILRAMAVWRSALIADALMKRYGARVLHGPFAGMQYVRAATEGALAPRLLGSYECELHSFLERFAAEGFDCVIDVGCAEGYYAVGLARLMPNATVYAYDTEERARDACKDLAARNGVEDRMTIGGTFSPGDFENFAGRKCLVIVDCEGAEVDVLQPEQAPALAQMTLIVETHDLYRRDALATIMRRFSPTHDIVRVETGAKATPLPPELARQSHIDQLLAVWEWRKGPTPWLVMTPKAQP